MNNTMALAVLLSLVGFGFGGCGGKEGSGSDGNTDSGSEAGADDEATGDDDAPGTGGATGTGTGGAASSAGRAPVVTSVPGNANLSELSPEQATDVCEETSAAMDPTDESRQRLLCTVLGLIDGAAAAEPVATCEASVAACVVAASETAEDPDCSSASDRFADCDATVDEVNQCLNAVLALEQEYGETLTCAASANALLMLATGEAASCLMLEEACLGMSE